MSIDELRDILLGALGLLVVAMVRALLKLTERVTRLEERLRWRRPSRDWPPPDE